MNVMEPYFLGIDIGTQGARVALIDVTGNLLAKNEVDFPLDKNSREEQSPLHWWEACLGSLQKLVKDVKGELDVDKIVAISVTSTSGTVIPLDSSNEPLHNALMYSDQRAKDAAKICISAAKEHDDERYTSFGTSSGLAKILWFTEEYPDKTKKINKWAHAADFITGKLSGTWGVTDYTNAFKSGYDVLNYEWPSFLFDKLGLKPSWFPEVVASGEVVGQLDHGVAELLGLSPAIKVTAGITDGCASQIASGAMKPGNWNTTIGTTMVIKGVTKEEIKDPLGRLYCHRHPSGFWMPGGASNTGADWVTNEFSDNLIELNQNAASLIPSNLLAYPLRQKGERFPFVAENARGFEPEGRSKLERFVANMEGVAYVERYAYEMIEDLSGEPVNGVFTAGGGSNSDVWLRIRANVMNKPIYRMKHVSGAVGAAILAASKTYFDSITESANAMTQIDVQVNPSQDLTESYELGYRRFLETLMEKGYIPKEKKYA